MEKSLFRKNIEQSFNTLEDLYSLGDPQLYPLIERLHFHLQEIDTGRKGEKLFFEEIQKPHETEGLVNLKRVFNEEVKRQTELMFRHLPAGVSFDLINGLEDPTLGQLDQIISSFPVIKEASTLFQFQKNIKLWIANDCFSFSGDVPMELSLEDLREEAYALTRKLFHREVLLTFEVFESQHDGYFKIRFHCHLKNSDNPNLFIPVDSNKILKISGLISRFQKPLSHLYQLGEHQAYEIKPSLEIDQLTPKKIEEISSENDRILFHFPFLFRPLSLIIKKDSGGDLSDSGENWSDLCAQGKLSVIDVDLFSLVQK